MVRRSRVVTCKTRIATCSYRLVFFVDFFFFFQAEDGIRDLYVTGVQTCALPILLLTLMLFAALSASAANDPVNPMNDRWGRVRFLLGAWEGTAMGQPGKGTVERTYELVLGGQFIEERNTSRYEPKTKGAEPEIHHHRGFLSYDKARKTFMLRHFHEEGFVNLYALNTDRKSTRLNSSHVET